MVPIPRHRGRDILPKHNGSDNCPSRVDSRAVPTTGPRDDDDNQPANVEHNPHTRVIGGTFEFALILPNAANPSCRRP